MQDHELERTLNICLSLRGFPSAELDPIQSLTPFDITPRIVNSLKNNQKQKDNKLLNIITRSAQGLLRRVTHGITYTHL